MSQLILRFCLLGVLCLLLTLLLACAKPDQVTTIKSPTEGVFYTVETFYGHGAIDTDVTRVYAHLERNGKSDKKLVLAGQYLEISKISWAGMHDATLCLQGGFTNSFHNEVTLSIDRDSEEIHNYLREDCGR